MYMKNRKNKNWVWVVGIILLLISNQGISSGGSSSLVIVWAFVGVVGLVMLLLGIVGAVSRK